MKKSDTEALLWLSQNAEWDDERGIMSYHKKDGTKVDMKIYQYPPGPPMIYVPSHHVINLAKGVHFMMTGEEVEVAVFKGSRSYSNIVAMTKAQQTAQAASHLRKERVLPPNIYATSGGQYVAKRGKHKTAKCGSVEEALEKLNNEEWIDEPSTSSAERQACEAAPGETSAE